MYKFEQIYVMLGGQEMQIGSTFLLDVSAVTVGPGRSYRFSNEMLVQRKLISEEIPTFRRSCGRIMIATIRTTRLDTDVLPMD